MSAGEFINLLKQASEQQSGGYAPFVYGHIASYDPATNSVRLVLPSVRDEGDNCAMTPWLPLGSTFAGAGFGIQVAPMGGATVDNPTKGELCLVQRVDRDQGAGVVACLVFNQVNTPPFADMKPGEVGVQSNAGCMLRMRDDGQIEITPALGKPVKIIGNLQVTGEVTGGVGTPDQVALRTHLHPFGGGSTGAPTPGS